MKIDLKIAKQYTFAFCIMGLIMTLSNTAFAATDSNAISDVLCRVVNTLQGTMGKAIATIALVVLGIGMFMGKLGWPLALATALGIGLIFGAPKIVEWIGGTTGAVGACGGVS